MGKEFMRERRKDHFYRSAKQLGYRARSAFKLQQIDKRFHILRSGQVVVDLGAAPGGWTQVAIERVTAKGLVVGVDLAPIKPIGGATFVRGDMTKEDTVQRVVQRIEERTGKTGRNVDVIISDMSPSISGNYSVDQARSYWLCHNALKFADRVLRAGGSLVTKIFEGEDFPLFRNELAERFSSVRTFSPPASRKESSEVYLIAKGYHGAAGELLVGPTTERTSDALREAE